MHDISLALVWHQHQPYYPCNLTGENPMPWVRLHGTKDYWGMATLLGEVPEMHATINLVPSLLMQLAGYTEAGHEDRHLRVSRLPADGLEEEDINYLMDNFFMAHVDTMVRPYARYWQLYQQRGFGVDTNDRAARRYSKQDIIDLQIWSNLAWFHPVVFEKNRDLAEFREKGRHWSENDKQWMLDRQMDILREVVPLHIELSRRGQVELTTTPMYHPILPLLWDKRQARRAMPEVDLPKRLESYAEDAVEQIRRGVAYHEKIFGQKPRGMWPSEGSVCQEMIAAVADAGIEWIATDEEILACSTDGWISRDENGFLRNPEMLYRPWHVEEQGRQLQIVFRDHAMSDQIGFHYQRYTAEQAVDDFIGKLEDIGRATTANAAHRPTLVSIILDGENCWEHYPHGGVDFFRELHRRTVDHPKITPRRMCDYLEEFPATDRLGHLFPGSWINHNFGIWIGHGECNRAWDLVGQTREHLKAAEAAAEKTAAKTPEQLAAAWEELYIAQGSDWFWWFGDDHSSAQDMLFDELFRKHLQNVYAALGDDPPGELLRPISHSLLHHRVHSQPTGFMSAKINGRLTYFEWLSAGHYQCRPARGTMTMAAAGRLKDLYFGFAPEHLLLRLDTKKGPVREQLADVDVLRITFLAPQGFELLISHPAWAEPIVQLYHNDVPVSTSGVVAAADAILEVSIPWRSLAVTTDDPVHFFIELLQDEKSVERCPSEGAIETTMPSP
ncbi:MAG: alpha-amylase/alpha-mannosidase, partial [Planctomycetes bacterium]|nr:alpha-amylase/alpha-mannosidase [Planctomycetota bacterium]